MSRRGSTSVSNELEKARTALLDLTLRNRLLNFRSSVTSSIGVVDESAQAVYNRLVSDEKVMSFSPSRKSKEPSQPDGQADVSDDASLPDETASDTDAELEETDDFSEDLWRLNETELAEKHTDSKLQTKLPDIELARRLFAIHNKSQEVLEEQGYNVLFLALGFLHWKQREDEEYDHKAPLVLVPVELKRLRGGHRYSISWTGEEIFTNVSLQARLKQDFGLKLPDFEMPDNQSAVSDYLSQVEKTVRQKPQWRVTGDIWLGFFSFTKFVMWKDLAADSWPTDAQPEDQALMSALFALAAQNEPEGDADIEEAAIASLDAQQVNHVLDADASQVAVIEKAKAGSSLVVEGPPGTGKSQTIANMIAELLAKGRSVLFVSEKMAALEVVHRRLNEIGLRDACLELHSHNTSRKSFYQELEHTLTQNCPAESKHNEHAASHAKLVAELNDYAAALRLSFGKSGWTPFQLFGLREASSNYFRAKSASTPRIPFENPADWTDSEYRDVYSLLKDVASIIAQISPIPRNPWHHTQPKVYTQTEIADVEDLCNEVHGKLRELEQLVERLAAATHTAGAQCLAQCSSQLRAVDVITAPHSGAASALFGFTGLDRSGTQSLDTSSALAKLASAESFKLNELMNTLEAIQRVKASFGGSVDLERGSVEAEGLLLEFSGCRDGFFRYFRPAYWRTRKRILGLYAQKQRLTDNDLARDLQNLVSIKNLRSALNEFDESARLTFGATWQGEMTNVEDLRALAGWMRELHSLIMDGAIQASALQSLATGFDKKQVSELVAALKEAETQTQSILTKLADKLALDVASKFNADLAAVRFEVWRSTITDWVGAIAGLPTWTKWCELRSRLASSRAKAMLAYLESEHPDPADIIPAYEGAFSESLLALVFQEKPALKHFNTEIHERRITEFRELDKALLKATRQKVSRQLWQDSPRRLAGSTPESDKGVLLGQLQRKRGHMPIRMLLERCGNLIQQIKPCFMMSPISIAQYLKPGAVEFDVVVFDEASQVKPQEALGAILRGKQLIVMGDSRQLPPTSFFDQLGTESQDNDDELYDDNTTSVTEVESILKQCKRAFPSKMLEWHYRSQHESLITVSNHQFYDNRLLVYPSANGVDTKLGLELRHLPDTVYDRGKSRTNRKEAAEVVKAVIQHYASHGWGEPHEVPSLGIGTFSSAQQEVIRKLLMRAENDYPELHKYMNREVPEYCFVKNLETIQGDERDVILISIGYGKNELGTMTMNFGPLNKDGGERRLNVLITRARQKCIVFSNFLDSDLRVDDSSPAGVAALKVFLKYALDRSLLELDERGGEFDSPFEEVVYEFLRDQGLEVRKQVGCAGYRIDLAVVNPQHPGSYILGVECDGASYHSTLVARDRDRLREEVLGRLGWRIHRIWSTDWYRNRASCETRLLAAIEEATKAAQASATENSSQLTTVQEHQAIEREAVSASWDEPVEIEQRDYQRCTEIQPNYKYELHSCPTAMLAEQVVKVVQVESPVHLEEVVTRLRTAWGLGRAGNRIREAVDRATHLAEAHKLVKVKGDFLWNTEPHIFRPRRRESDLLNIEYISAEEITGAMVLLLRTQLATPEDELLKAAARLFGYQAVHTTVMDRLRRVLNEQLGKGLIQRRNGSLLAVSDDCEMPD